MDWLPVYHKPQDTTCADPAIPSFQHFRAIHYFLEQVERLEHGVIDDLKQLIPLFNEQVTSCLSKETVSWNNVWTVLQQESNSACSALRDAMLAWGLRWNLADSEGHHPLYLNIALQAISNYLDDVSDDHLTDEGSTVIWGPNDLAHWSEEEWKRRHAEARAEEAAFTPQLSLSKAVDFDVEDDIIPPFSFTPTIESLFAGMQIPNRKTYDFGEPEAFEQLIHGSDESQGIRWDPTTQWDSFTKQLDQLYEKYKEAYKARAELIIQERELEKSFEKRERGFQHYEWLVRYQVQGWSVEDVCSCPDYDKITEIDGLRGQEPDTVKRGLKLAASHVLLTLR